MLPLQTLESTTKTFYDPLVWAVVSAHLVPPGGTSQGAFSLYEDDGAGLDYRLQNAERQ
jgi:hypothetical protein